jgi:hypothetical protein
MIDRLGIPSALKIYRGRLKDTLIYRMIRNKKSEAGLGDCKAR